MSSQIALLISLLAEISNIPYLYEVLRKGQVT